MRYAKAILVSFALAVPFDILVDMVPDRVMNAVLFAIAGALLLGLVLVAVGTVRKNRWGINQEPVNCPACGSLMPPVRQPESFRQALWGGWTCTKCACKMDKWGRLIAGNELDVAKLKFQN